MIVRRSVFGQFVFRQSAAVGQRPDVMAPASQHGMDVRAQLRVALEQALRGIAGA
jgi:hypothetical protein